MVNNQQLIESLDYHIHEVSVNLWKKAAQNSLAGRAKKAQYINSPIHKKLIKNYEDQYNKVYNTNQKNWEKGLPRQLKREKFLNNRLGELILKDEKINDRYKHALDVISLPDSKVSAIDIRKSLRKAKM